MNNYQIFISYRREGGDALAGRLADRFNTLGYRVFYDVESMRSGEFNKQLLVALAQCEGVILVLPPNALDRCINEYDWVRQEIAFALKHNKKIIPVMMRGFEFPTILPTDIEKIRFMEGVSASNEYFDAVIDRIENLLKIKKPKVSGKTATSKATSSIKIPALLSTPDSKFMAWAQLCLKEIEQGHFVYSSTQECVMKLSLDDYLEQKLLYSEDVEKKPAFVLDQKKEKYTQEYNWYRNFKSETRKLVQANIGVHDDSIVEAYVDMIVTVRNYISDLYKEQPLGYQTRIAELLWLFFDFNYPSGKSLLTRPAQEHLFQDICVISSEGIYYGERCHGLIRKNKYEILKEVSCTVQLIATGIRDNAEQNLQLALFISSVSLLYILCECPEKAKRFKKYLLINYKYLQKKGVVLSDECEEAFSKSIEVCDSHIKINRE